MSETIHLLNTDCPPQVTSVPARGAEVGAKRGHSTPATYHHVVVFMSFNGFTDHIFNGAHG